MEDTINVSINNFKFTLKLIEPLFSSNRTNNQLTCLESECYIAAQLPQFHYLDDYRSSILGSLFCQVLVDCAVM